MQDNPEMSSIQRQINAHLFRLFYNLERGLPPLDLLNEAIDEARPEYASRKYVSKLYWVLTDLLSIVYREKIESIEVDRVTRSITVVKTRHLTPVGIERVTSKNTYKSSFDHFYADLPSAHFNESLDERELHEVTKIETYAKNVPVDELASIEAKEDIHFWAQIDLWDIQRDRPEQTSSATIARKILEKTKTYLSKLFEPVIEKRWKRLTFEDFIADMRPNMAAVPIFNPASNFTLAHYELFRQQKQHLDSLRTFDEKKQYLTSTFGTVKPTIFFEEEHGEFSLGLTPQTEEERHIYHQALIDEYRIEFARNGELMKGNQGKTAFVVKTLDSLEVDFQARFNKAILPERQKSLLEGELAAITKEIDEAQKTSFFISSNSSNAANELRQSLARYQPINLVLTDQPWISSILWELAMFWDIVHYEDFLKTSIAKLNAGHPLMAEVLSDTPSQLMTAPDKGKKTATVRGPYKKFKAEVLRYYERAVRDKIEEAVRMSKALDRSKIEKAVEKKIMENTRLTLSERTYRSYLPTTYRAELFGEIHRQVLELKRQIDK